MKQPRNKQGKFGTKFPGLKDHIRKLIGEGKSDAQIILECVQMFRGVSVSTVNVYVNQLRHETTV